MQNPEQKISVLPPSEPITPESLKKSADGWWRTQSATIALLKHAYHLVGASEQRIAEQEKRIRQLEDLASTDPLTGLMNRRGFEKFFDHELARIRRKHSPGALFALIDLDHFKEINDRHGHLAGDACLRLVSEKILQSIRMLDGAARFGGDEFSVLLTQLEPEKSTSSLRKVRQALAEMTLDWQGQKIRLGASIGVQEVTADSEYESVYDAADANLYADKRRRRKTVLKKV